MMRVNSPGPESAGGSGVNGAGAAGADCSWARRWMRRVTPPGSAGDDSEGLGGTYDGTGSGR
jgi:hypothetical protein